jgi:hypothetical protein
MAIERNVMFKFTINLAEGDDPANYPEGFPYVTEYAQTEEEARDKCERFHLEEGETLGQLIERGW